MTAKIYKCHKCALGFAIFEGAKKNQKISKRESKGIACPVCHAKDVEEVDALAAVGASLARKAWDLWLKLPSGD